MDEFNKKTFNEVVKKIRERDDLQKKFYRNEEDYIRLGNTNIEIIGQLENLDRTITSMVKPKEVKKDG